MRVDSIHICKNTNLEYAEEGLRFPSEETRRDHIAETVQTFNTTVAGTVKPKFHLIPREALLALVERFEVGERNHVGKEGFWNATTSQEPLTDLTRIRARADHVIQHTLLWLAKYEGSIPDDGDDDAAAIMWGGAFLHSARRVKKNG